MSMADNLETLTVERDDARRRVCELTVLATPNTRARTSPQQQEREFAAEQGWDCFDEAEHA